ncbi:SAM-dependent methlyltransferase [Legionella norrlandica]|uniref:SAM-dependent methlyltransferase n=1 Tax=Legionella norrlandica TaxID=1498499 RepID=A0A0A2SSK8_9GAMM|nr:FkbM family methyltransferase [Legionella norrlandica]KGP62716.1 SAM-dependent methlyltransferase [Legionella norrlandica]
MPNKISRKQFAIGDLYFINEFEVNGLIHEIFHQKSYLPDFLTLNAGSVVFDVGANIGIFSLFALKQCHYDIEIYSFEPIPATFKCLKKNLARFKHNVHLYNTGIGNTPKDCSIDFTLFGESSVTATYKPSDKIISNFQPLLNYETLLKLSYFQNKSLYYQLKYLPFLRNYFIKKNYKNQTLETKVKCQLTSLGRFIEKNQIAHIDLLKIDVEGAELDVINSIKPEQFSFIKQLSIEVHDIDNRVEKLVSYLQKLGYVAYVDKNPIFAELGFNHHMIYAKIPEPTIVRQHEEQNNHENYIEARQYFYGLLAGGVRVKLLESMFELDLFRLFNDRPYWLENEIIKILELKPVRAKKWLHLLCCENFLKKITIGAQTGYQLAKSQLLLGDGGWGFKQYYDFYWQRMANEKLSSILRFTDPRFHVTWPPQNAEEANFLETWMTKTATPLIQTLFAYLDFNQYHSILDVGGGDGTIACALAQAYPHLKITVYNLPESAKIAQKHIATMGLQKRISVFAGDFIQDEQFPSGFDLILFVRVLWDWDESRKRKLLNMAYHALKKKGHVAICEGFKELCYDLCLTWEYSYIFADDFGTEVFKTSDEYKVMLQQIGFTPIPTQSTPASHTPGIVLLAEK